MLGLCSLRHGTCTSAVLFAAFSMPVVALAQPPEGKPIAEIAWQEGPGPAKLGSIAQIVLPEGYRFAAGPGARQFMELIENPTSGRELGVVLPTTGESSWFMMFEFNSIGYVKDDEKDSLDADALLDNFKKGMLEATPNVPSVVGQRWRSSVGNSLLSTILRRTTCDGPFSPPAKETGSSTTRRACSGGAESWTWIW